MKPRSKTSILFALAVLLLAGTGLASNHAFDLVPANDSTYSRLSQLEDAGLLTLGDAKGPLTRFEVAQRIWRANEKYQEIVVAQSDMELPPPPPDDNSGAATPAAPAGNAAPAAGTAPAATTEAVPATKLETWNDPQKIAEAEKNLKTLQEAYDYELELVKDQKASVADQVTKAEADQYDLWKAVRGIVEYPSISLHGVSRLIGVSTQFYGNYAPISIINPTIREAYGYMDLIPTGSITKEVRFNAIIRLGTQLLPVAKINNNSATQNNDYIQARWISADFNPDFMTATLGDFYEVYTPLTLWSRDVRDLYFEPEMISRDDKLRRYESFFDQQPAWPFRGLRVGTSIGWPDPQVFESIGFSAFAHMIRTGFSDKGGGWYLTDPTGKSVYTDWIFAGKGGIKTAKWYLGDASLQLSTEGVGILLTEPLNTEQPGSAYGQYLPQTWAHQYVITSVKPKLQIGFGDDIYAGGQYEGSFSSYQDDTRNPGSVTSDYAVILGAFFQAGDSKVTFNYMDVGPYFYSPLAQTRQDYQPFNYYSLSPGLIVPIYTGQFFLTSVPRPGGIYGFYDRTLDNTFPYGLATPNRKGFGMDVDVETLQSKALKLKGAAYFLSEIAGNMVLNAAQTGFTALDPTASGTAPIRNFTYVNAGPSIDIGPLVGLVTPLEFGGNIRFEQTTSMVGNLNSLGLWVGTKAGFFTWWEAAVSFGLQNVNGTEEGYSGTPFARYSYVFDNSDLGKYSPFTESGTDQYLFLSTNFKLDNNSNIFVDYDLSSGNVVPNGPQLSGSLNNQFMRVTYEVEF